MFGITYDEVIRYFFKKDYTAKHIALLKILSDNMKNAMKTSEKRLYNVLFTIVREEFDTVHKFIK